MSWESDWSVPAATLQVPFRSASNSRRITHLSIEAPRPGPVRMTGTVRRENHARRTVGYLSSHTRANVEAP
jgi:hypothetical protein